MADDPLAGLPAPVKPYLTELTRRLADGLGEQLSGVYLTGSAALGAFDPSSSDLDVVGICTDAVSLVERRDLVAVVRHEALPCPARGLELVVYPLATTRGSAIGPGFVLELNDGPGMPFSAALAPSERSDTAADFWYVIDRSILRAAGRPLRGPAVTELVVEPGRQDLLAALTASVDWHRAAGSGQRRNTVLNACRAWRWVVDGVWTSKPAAGDWALARSDRSVAPAVTAALEARPIDARAMAAVLDAVEEILRRAAAAT